ncbi:MAG: phosphoribosylglycinamide formyltransferase [Balneolaceae bacterium]|nr:phosphoribosylglycinamide formyltransferase [Balneolaceae bacterium]
MKHIVVFASGSGTNFQALIDAVESGNIDARIRGLVSNRSGIKALERAEKHGIETYVAEPSSFESHQLYVRSLIDKLKEWKTDLIVLAGYMIKVPAEIIEEYSGRIINIHPSLLPKYGGKGFYGINVHRAVLENNEKESGCTVHLVTEEYDKGPILGQIKVPVKSSDTPERLAERVLEKEHELLPEIVDRLINELNPKSYT